MFLSTFSLPTPTPIDTSNIVPTMGKNKKKRHRAETANQQFTATPKPKAFRSNPLETAQQSFLKSLSTETRSHFFSNKHVTPQQRAKIWEDQADLGEKLVNKYAWATPDTRLLKVFQHFAPIVEMGCGSNAYWAKWMHAEGGVDVIAFDASLEMGGKINIGTVGKKKNKKCVEEGSNTDGLIIRQGGPSALSTHQDVANSRRTLFLCYPDEEEYQESSSDEESSYDHDINNNKPKSMAAACLEHFTGSTIIHVGELYGDTLGLDQSPWGRSSSCEFQERLAAEYHCLLKMKLQNNWLHVRDTLSVWKRTETCAMMYENDSEEEDGSVEEDTYKYIPPNEKFPMDIAAPCLAHLLETPEFHAKLNVSEKELKPIDSELKKVRKKKHKNDNACGNETKQQEKKKTKHKEVIAGNAW